MQSSSKFTIAIHICLYLKFKDQNLVSSQQIAESVKTNPVVIRRMIGCLRENGIVGSVAGSKGGYFLKRPSKKITLWKIYNCVKNNDLFNKPRPNPDCVVSSNLSELVDDAYRKAENSMKSVLDKTTIDQLNHKLSDIIQAENFC